MGLFPQTPVIKKCGPVRLTIPQDKLILWKKIPQRLVKSQNPRYFEVIPQSQSPTPNLE